MSERPSGTRVRARGMKTWSALGNLGRRPTEYEILTHGMNHTMGPVPLELGPDVHGNRWLREHRDSMRLQVDDWNAFRDPDALTYGSYVAMQDDQETYVEGLLEQFDEEDYDAGLTAPALDLLARCLTPSRYLAHGQQMLSSYIHQLAASSYVGNCAVFQTADQLRRVQLVAYRTKQLQLAHPERGFGTAERAVWQEHPGWQPVRRAVETALVEFDWDRAFVATNLVVKPVADLLFLDGLAVAAGQLGATLDALILDNLRRDAERSRRWTAALLTFLVEQNPANREVLQEYLTDWESRGHDMVAAGTELLGDAIPDAATADAVISDTAIAATAVYRGWQDLLDAAGLSVQAPQAV